MSDHVTLSGPLHGPTGKPPVAYATSGGVLHLFQTAESFRAFLDATKHFNQSGWIDGLEYHP